MFKHMFSDNEQEKLTDKSFIRFIVTSILAIAVCIICLCSSTWAWFTDSISDNSSELTAADKCLISMTITDKNGTEIADLENGLDLVAGEEYSVTLSLPTDSASGYCIVQVGEHKYYTDYIKRHYDDTPHTVSFKMISSKDQKATFTLCWGIYSCDSDVIGGTLNID